MLLITEIEIWAYCPYYDLYLQSLLPFSAVPKRIVFFFSFCFRISPNNNILIIDDRLTLILLNTVYFVLANSVDPDQLASEEANWSGSALFVIKYVKFYQKPWSCNLIGWKIEVGVASLSNSAMQWLSRYFGAYEEI